MKGKISLYFAEIANIIATFGRSINFWYPSMSSGKVKAAQSIITEGQADESPSSCLAFLVMALGCANLTISVPDAETNLSKTEIESPAAHHRAMGDVYMDTVRKKLYVVHMEVSTTATQCLFFIA